LHLGYFALPPSIFFLAATSHTPCLLPRCSRQQQPAQEQVLHSCVRARADVQARPLPWMRPLPSSLALDAPSPSPAGACLLHGRRPAATPSSLRLPPRSPPMAPQLQPVSFLPPSALDLWRSSPWVSRRAPTFPGRAQGRRPTSPHGCGPYSPCRWATGSRAFLPRRAEALSMASITPPLLLPRARRRPFLPPMAGA
jgi:hypothetical protein